MDGSLYDRDLYDRDYHAWALDQARALRRLADLRSNMPIDLEHLAEEIEDMGNNELDVVAGNLVQVIVHLLKLEYSHLSEPRLHWRGEVGAMRVAARRKLRRSPTVRHKLDTADLYDDALKILAGVAPQLARDVPEACPYALDQLLDPDWYPANRHGLTDEA